MDNKNVKITHPILNLENQSTTPQASQANQDNSNQQRNKPPFARTFIPKKRTFTPLGESLESALRKLITRKLITLPEVRDYEPTVKPSWWRDEDYCEYHRGKGHNTNDC